MFDSFVRFGRLHRTYRTKTMDGKFAESGNRLWKTSLACLYNRKESEVFVTVCYVPSDLGNARAMLQELLEVDL